MRDAKLVDFCGGEERRGGKDGIYKKTKPPLLFFAPLLSFLR